MKQFVKENRKLYYSLLFLALFPAIYQTFRVYLVGQLPDSYSFSIAGQLSWVNLLYEILREAFILPMYFFIGHISKENRASRTKTIIIIGTIMYAVMFVLLFIFIRPLLSVMAVEKDIFGQAVNYIRIESFANIFAFVTETLLVLFVVIGKRRWIYVITICKTILTMLTDIFFLSENPYSLRLGINGIGYSNIVINIGFIILLLYVLQKIGYRILSAEPDFSWTKELCRIGGISGIESLVRNLAYMMMISRMVNVVSEQGTYWVANNFIWGWLLLPILQLAELIKQNVAENPKRTLANQRWYFKVTSIICIGWLISIPLWKPFMKYVLGIADVEKIISLVLILLIFYILFAYQNIFDSIFYGVGKTEYMLAESVVTNVVYYGFMYILYMKGIWIPTLNGIAWMFGFGMAFDAIVSYIVYRIFVKKTIA